jgi:hypothetical protein
VSRRGQDQPLPGHGRRNDRARILHLMSVQAAAAPTVDRWRRTDGASACGFRRVDYHPQRRQALVGGAVHVHPAATASAR